MHTNIARTYYLVDATCPEIEYCITSLGPVFNVQVQTVVLFKSGFNRREVVLLGLVLYNDGTTFYRSIWDISIAMKIKYHERYQSDGKTCVARRKKCSLRLESGIRIL